MSVSTHTRAVVSSSARTPSHAVGSIWLVEQDLLEHAALEQAEPRQSSLGLGAQPARRKAQRGRERAVTLDLSIASELIQQLAEVGHNVFGRQLLQMRADQLDRQRMIA
jgi:hypothetical protein